MKRAIVILIVMLFLCTSVEARPKHWYKDWKVWTGIGVIAASTIADGQSTCRDFARGGHEIGIFATGTQSCALVSGGLVAATSIYLTAYILENRHFESDDSKIIRAISLTMAPAIVFGYHGTAAIHNYSLDFPGPVNHRVNIPHPYPFSVANPVAR